MQSLQRLTWTLKKTVKRHGDRGRKVFTYCLLKIRPGLRRSFVATAAGRVWRKSVEYIGRMKLLLPESYCFV